ncbi:DNA-directed RNA polymerase subunit alpha C-terminal domain-containing protein [Rummeliibacillus stabekisii]|uniref:RNA polymerase alpha subunit C-terminal domain-containing protein n=1 Tax=Rummeliibacillus stabekisii TaxID=241244 RepID=A0A143HC60_9BACL|nr:hypothetical protein ATY39_07535 [Rummeliibacillus stabekisii]
MTIDSMDLSVRAHHTLKRAGIIHISQLRNMSDKELLSIKNFNQKCLEEVKMKFMREVNKS